MRSHVLRAWLPMLLLAVAVGLVFLQVKRPVLLVSVMVPWAEVGVLALVMTVIVLTGGIDLSVGAMVSLCGMVQAVLWKNLGWPIHWAACAAIASGLLAGGFNGLLVAAGLSPLVATLATMAFYRGLAMAISGAERITGFPEPFLEWQRFAGVPSQFWLLLVVFVVSSIVVHFTHFGRWCFAVGDNRLAAQFAAVPIRCVDWALYATSGCAASLVAVLNTMRHNVAIPDAAMGVELQAIACVVVGGTLITGGQGSIPRTLLGLAVIAHVDIGLQFLSTRMPLFTAESRLIMIGVLLISIAVFNERMQCKRERVL